MKKLFLLLSAAAALASLSGCVTEHVSLIDDDENTNGTVIYVSPADTTAADTFVS